VTGDRPSRRLAWLSLYAVAMGLLEAAVVVYLRELYYPGGFAFPLVVLPERVAVVELLREAATVVMILAVAGIAGTERTDRFLVFGYVFGVWDIVYYAGLWAFLDWPASLLDWDVLFLIPVPWLGPVLYPVVVSLLLIGGFLLHEGLGARGRALRLTWPEWAAAWVGALCVVVAFCWNRRIVAEGAVPTRFPLWLYLAGLLAGVAPFVRAAARAWGSGLTFQPPRDRGG
jgi:hypothetical protein